MRTRAFVLAGVAALVAAKAFAQARPTFEIAPFIGYRFGGSVGDTYSAATYGIDGAASAGVTVSVSVGKTTAIELLFSRQDTGVDVAAYPSTQHHALTIDHWMAGAVGEFPDHSGRVHPFVAAYLGLTQIQNSNGYTTSSTYFTGALGGGVKLDVAKHVAIRFDARAYYVFVSTSGGMFCGGGGCSASFSSSGLLQGEGTASLVIKL